MSSEVDNLAILASFVETTLANIGTDYTEEFAKINSDAGEMLLLPRKKPLVLFILFLIYFFLIYLFKGVRNVNMVQSAPPQRTKKVSQKEPVARASTSAIAIEKVKCIFKKYCTSLIFKIRKISRHSSPW